MGFVNHKKRIIILKRFCIHSILLLFICVTYGQAPFHIIGNLQVHNQGQLGFHTDLINDGDFDQNMGEVGFYHNTRELTISGTRPPVFYDMITNVVQDLQLEVTVGVRHFKSFNSGRILTPRADKNISLRLQDDTPYLGEEDDRHVDGYVSQTGVLDFTFPIGDDFRLRPMRIEAFGVSDRVQGAYFFENPNQPTTFSTAFDTARFEPSIAAVSLFEFWELDGDISTKITLTWDPNSNIPALATELSNLRVVGWNALLNTWVDLGNTNTSGTMDNGEITSAQVRPDVYEVITIGSVLKAGEEIFAYTGFSPNGDGINDTFVINGIEANPNNELKIYNRWGTLVYRKKGYDNRWKGISDGRVTISKNESLPVGTYYYVLELNGKKSKSGYVYINY